MFELNIRNVINNSLADDDEKGNVVFREIISHQENGQNEIILNFEGIELVNTAFLNNAIGKLFNPEQFDLKKASIKVLNMSENMVELLRESIKTARLTYKS